MSIEQTEIIDFISTNLKGEVVLTISDHLDWNPESNHLWLLQEKINSYLLFIESGEINKKYPDAKGRRFVISVKLMNQPTAEALTFFDQVRSITVGAGVGLQYEHTPLIR